MKQIILGVLLCCFLSIPKASAKESPVEILESLPKKTGILIADGQLRTYTPEKLGASLTYRTPEDSLIGPITITI